jgi:hypothetical protein
MTFDMTQIVLALIGILASIITAVVIPWLRAKLGDAQWGQLIKIAGVAVHAAEMLYGADAGQEKLSYALDQVNQSLRKQGLSFDENSVRAAVEAAVLGVVQAKQAAAKAAPGA